MNCCLLSQSRTDYAAICKYSICNNVTVTYVSHTIMKEVCQALTCIFKYSLFSDIVQVANAIKYPGRTTIALPEFKM